MNTLARATAGAAFFLLVAGAMVTSTGSGLAVPDWPLAFGQIFPEMTGGVFFEHGHRMVAGVVAAMTLALGIWAYLHETYQPVRLVIFAACAAIVVQALLGGLTVYLRLPPQVSIAHACLAQAVFCLLVAAAQMTSSWYRSDALPRAPRPWKLGALAVGAVYFQLFWGALARHTGRGVWIHAAWAAVVAVVLLLAIRQAWKDPASRRFAAGLSLLLPLQIALGLVSYQLRVSGSLSLDFHRAAAVTAAHLAIGAAILGATLAMTLRQRRLSPA